MNFILSFFKNLYQVFNYTRVKTILVKSKEIVKPCLAFITIYLTLFAVGIARYELSLVTLHSKISYLVMMSEGKNYKYALERVPELQQLRLPVEPRIDNPLSILKSIHYKYDNINLNAYEDLYELIISNKDNLNNLNLNGLILPIKFYNLSEISIKNTKFIRAELPSVLFKSTEFINVDFWGANMIGTDCAFAIFRNSFLRSVDFRGSNLCGVQFIDTDYVHADFSNTNLVGADLSQMLVDSGKFKPQPQLQGAAYNSQNYSFYNFNFENSFGKYTSCLKQHYLPPTKFPLDFNPEEYGMIDLSKF